MHRNRMNGLGATLPITQKLAQGAQAAVSPQYAARLELQRYGYNAQTGCSSKAIPNLAKLLTVAGYPPRSCGASLSTGAAMAPPLAYDTSLMPGSIEQRNREWQRQASANLVRADAMSTIRQPTPSPTNQIPLQISGGGGALSAAEQDYMIDLALSRDGAVLNVGQQPPGPTATQVFLYGLAGLAALGIVVLAFKK